MPIDNNSTDASLKFGRHERSSELCAGQRRGHHHHNGTDGRHGRFSVVHLDPRQDGILGTSDDLVLSDISGTTAPWTVTDGGADDLDGLANGVLVTMWSVGQDAAGLVCQVTATDTITGAVAILRETDRDAVPVVAKRYGVSEARISS